jgi:hypothetical protein
MWQGGIAHSSFQTLLPPSLHLKHSYPVFATRLWICETSKSISSTEGVILLMQWLDRIGSAVWSGIQGEPDPFPITIINSDNSCIC